MNNDNLKEKLIGQVIGNPHVRIIKRSDVLKVNYLTCPFCGKEKHFSLFLPKTIPTSKEAVAEFISKSNGFGYVCYRCKKFKYPEKNGEDIQGVIAVLDKVLKSSTFKENDIHGYARAFTIFALWELYLKKFNKWEENFDTRIIQYLSTRNLNFADFGNTNIKFYTFNTVEDKLWKKGIKKYKKRLDKIVNLKKFKNFMAISGGYPNSGIVLRNLNPNASFRYYTAFDMPIFIKHKSFTNPITIIMTEGIMDVLSLYSILKQVSDLDITKTLFVSANGLRFLSALSWVKKLYGNWKVLYIIGDNDYWVKGKVIKYPLPLLPFTYFLRYPKYKDFNDFIRYENVSINSFSELLSYHLLPFHQKRAKKVINTLHYLLNRR